MDDLTLTRPEDFKREMRERSFMAVCRAWYAQKANGQKPKRSMLEMGRTEYGFSMEEAYKLSHQAMSVGRRGTAESSAVLVIRIQKRDQYHVLTRPSVFQFGTPKKAA